MTCIFGGWEGGTGNGNSKSKGKGKGKGEIQGSLHCGGKCAAFGRDDVHFWRW
jgi:hypothetical protein